MSWWKGGGASADFLQEGEQRFFFKMHLWREAAAAVRLQVEEAACALALSRLGGRRAGRQRPVVSAICHCLGHEGRSMYYVLDPPQHLLTLRHPGLLI